MAETHTASSRDAQEGGGIINRVKESATAQLTNQKNRGTDALGQIAGAVRESTQKLRNERHDTIAGYVDQAANQLESVSRRLRERDINELVSDVQRLARRQPAVFIGSAFALGLLGARFLKSSPLEQAGGDFAAESRRRYGGDAVRGTVHDDSGRDRATGAVVASEAGFAGIESEPGAPLSGAEGTGRSARPRRSTSRTGQE